MKLAVSAQENANSALWRGALNAQDVWKSARICRGLILTESRKSTRNQN
jgi:hypothetical protein